MIPSEQVSDVFSTFGMHIAVLDQAWWREPFYLLCGSIMSFLCSDSLPENRIWNQSQTPTMFTGSSSCIPDFACPPFLLVHTHPALTTSSSLSKPSAFSQGVLWTEPSWMGCSPQRAAELADSLPSGITQRSPPEEEASFAHFYKKQSYLLSTYLSFFSP